MKTFRELHENMDAFSKDAVEQLDVKHAFRYVTKSGQGTHYHHSSDKADATKAIEKSTGQRVLGINHIGTGIPSRREGKAASRDSLQKAIDVFKKRGGKIKKVAPGKAAGYHGKDDPGKDVSGMMDRGDTKAVGTRKKVKSMEAKEANKEVK